ncbi:MAG: hypothetical protein AAF449_16790 [Myxococcota bacterium]
MRRIQGIMALDINTENTSLVVKTATLPFAQPSSQKAHVLRGLQSDEY